MQSRGSNIINYSDLEDNFLYVLWQDKISLTTMFPGKNICGLWSNVYLIFRYQNIIMCQRSYKNVILYKHIYLFLLTFRKYAKNDSF